MSASMDSHEAETTASTTSGQPSAEQQPATEPPLPDVPHEPGARPTPLSRLLYP